MDVPAGRVPLWLKIGWTLWIFVWAPMYWSYYGPQAFLWFCDIGNVVLGVALWRESRLLFSWQAVSLLLVQSCWCIDLAGRLILGVHPLGGTEYMFNGAWPLSIRLLSLFHAAIPPLLIWALRRFGYDRRAFRLQVAVAWLWLPVCYFLTDPKRDINWVRGPFDKTQTHMAPGLYLIVCMLGYALLLYAPMHGILSWWSARRERGAVK